MKAEDVGWFVRGPTEDPGAFCDIPRGKGDGFF